MVWDFKYICMKSLQPITARYLRLQMDIAGVRTWLIHQICWRNLQLLSAWFVADIDHICNFLQLLFIRADHQMLWLIWCINKLYLIADILSMEAGQLSGKRIPAWHDKLFLPLFDATGANRFGFTACQFSEVFLLTGVPTKSAVCLLEFEF